jgi:DNA modification methylase
MAVKCLGDAHGRGYALYWGDCVEVLRQLPDGCVDFSVYSPPFGDLFVYSDSERDMGNSSCDGQFFDHYRFAIAEIARLTKPGRLTAVHCSDLPYRKWKDGLIGIRDFSGQIVKAHEDAGFVLHSRVTVWKCPVVEMTRTKALGLLYKQLKKDSTKSRTGMPDYLLVFRAPGENAIPVEHKPAEFPVELWQQWASPVWMDIQQSNTLNVSAARSENDERHLCPLQLDLIKRALVLWSNPGETVLSPFAGVGSEGVVSLASGRRFIGAELKEEYFKQAVKNLDGEDRQCVLFGSSGS